MADRVQLDATHAIRVVATEQGHRAEPVTASSGEQWRRSTPGDGAGLAVLHRLRNRMAVEDGFRVTMQAWVAPDDDSERAMGVDQLNESWVVGGTLVVKWVTDDLSGPHPGPDRMRVLADAGFEDTPTLVGLVEWQNPDGDWVPVAVVQELLPGAEDGWTWAVSEALRSLGREAGPPTRFGLELGRLTARMHLALARGGREEMTSELVTAYHEDAVSMLDEATRVTSVSDPASHALLVEQRPTIESWLQGFFEMVGSPGHAIHGDFHVGQVLRTPDGRLHVVDFDGNPTRPPRLRVAPDAFERDLAAMGQSLENVGHLVRHHHPEVDDEALRAWVEQAQGDFLSEWLDRAGPELGYADVGSAFDVEQLCREFVYAARHLPSWGYVPAAVLRSRIR